MNKRIFVVGSEDPEMRLICSILHHKGERVAYACIEESTPDGSKLSYRRVSPNEAHCAHAVCWWMSDAKVYRPIDTIDTCMVWVECRVPDQLRPEELVDFLVDHHSKGDPVLGRRPSEYWIASSLGQVCELLSLGIEFATREDGQVDARWVRTPGCRGHSGKHGLPISAFEQDWQLMKAVRPEDALLVAAADHCLIHAYAGRCPGVDPEALARFRAKSRAAFQRRSVEDVLRDVEAANIELRAAPRIDIGRPVAFSGKFSGPGQQAIVRDMRRDRPVPELPEAAARLGESYLSGPLIGPDGRRKYTVSGPTSVVRQFLTYWAPRMGLVDTYSDPERGLAGGYELHEGNGIAAPLSQHHHA